jgi:hypothetical protein
MGRSDQIKEGHGFEESHALQIFDCQQMTAGVKEFS